jgi:hypothetical protein
MAEGYSISRAIRDVLTGGVPKGKAEAEFHFDAIHNSEKRSGLVRQLGWPGRGIVDRYGALLSTSRQLTLGTSGWTGPIEDLGVLAWSAVARAGAVFLGPLQEHINVWHTSELPPAEWLDWFNFSDRSKH